MWLLRRLNRKAKTTRQEATAVNIEAGSSSGSGDRFSENSGISSLTPSSVFDDGALIESSSRTSNDLVGSKSAYCSSIIATEAALLLLNQCGATTPGLIDQVIDNCSYVDCDHSLPVTEVLENIDRYSRGLQILSEKDISANDLGSVKDLVKNEPPFAILLMKPPEAISITVLSPHLAVLFDLNVRASSKGAAYFRFCNGLGAAMMEVARLWPSSSSDLQSDSTNETFIYEDLVINDSIRYFVVGRSSVKLHLLPHVSLWKLKYNQLCIKVDQLSKEVNNLKSTTDDLLVKNEQLSARLSKCMSPLKDCGNDGSHLVDYQASGKFITPADIEEGLVNLQEPQPPQKQISFCSNSWFGVRGL